MITDKLILPDGRQIASGEQVSLLSLTYSKKVNAEENFMPGCACCAQIEVKLLDETGSFSIAPGTEIAYYRGEKFMGKFYTEKATRPGKHTLSFVAYDAMVKAEADLTAWLATLPDWPYTIGRLLELVCEECGIEMEDAPLLNGDYPVLQFARQVTGRQLIGWAAEAAGAYAHIGEDGRLTFSYFTENPTPITLRHCKTLTLAEAPCAPIDRVAIGQQAGDLAAVWPENAGGECLHITGNPLLTAFSQEALTACAKNIYDRVAGFTYTPLEAELFAETEDIPWQPGQLVWVDDRLCAVFSLQLSGAGVKLQSSGAPSRESVSSRYSRDTVTLLQGQMARVEEKITGVSAQVGKVTTQLQELEVGGRNRILSSRNLDHESYYFSGGGATSDTATVTGNPLVITDVDPANPQLRLQGSDTIRCYGKNLMRYPYYYGSTTISGMTFTDNGDGTVTLNGTAGAQVVYYMSVKGNGIPLPAGATVTLSGTPKNSSTSLYYIQGTDETSYPTETGNGITFTASGGDYRFYIVVKAGVTAENVVFRPQLELGRVATEFESYSCDVYTPDPDGCAEGAARYPVTTLISDSGTITATYSRISLLARVLQTPPEGTDPVLRFTIEQLPQSFVMPGLLQPGEIYTLSFWAKGEGTLKIEGREISLTESWEKYECTFTAQGEDLALEFATVGTFDLYHPQLELGSIPSDWSVAPEDNEAVLLTTREEISRLQVEADKISAQVTRTETATRADLQLVQTDVQTLKKQTELSVTGEQMELAITKALEQGSQKVVTRTGYTFDEKGLTIATDRSDIKNLLDHTGMQVTRGDEILLRADNAGVAARDVTVHNYLVIGSHARVEDYPQNRTACFWL